LKQLFIFLALRASLAIGLMVLSVSASAQSVVYDFKLSGGAMKDPITTAGSYMFVDVEENLSSPNDVLFTFTFSSSFSQPVAGLGKFSFDVGGYTDLFSSISVYDESPGVDMTSVTAVGHPYYSTLTPDYAFSFLNGVLYDSRMVNPGEYLTVLSTLGAGKTYGDVIDAMNLGINPETATSGLRIGILGYNFLGIRPDPNVTLGDDAGFITYSVITAVPLPSALPMMLSGLGLMGFMARRRKV